MKTDIALSVFDPQQIADVAVQKVNGLKDDKTPRFLTNLPGFDDTYVMFRRKKVTGILADTSNYKTGMMTILAREFVPQLAGDEIGLFCTWEDSVEDFAIADMANISRVPLPEIYGSRLGQQEYNALMRSATVRATMPLWIAGHSEYVDARRPRLTMTDIFHAAEYIVDKQNRKIAFVMFDYLQRISRADCKGDIREGFMEIMDKVKDFSNAFNCCAVIGSQVRREIEKRDWRQPNEHDAQETSNFEHTCDGIITLQIPARYKKPYPDKDAMIQSVSDKVIYSTKQLLAAQIVKQKKAAFGDIFFWNINYEHNSIGAYVGPK